MGKAQMKKPLSEALERYAPLVEAWLDRILPQEDRMPREIHRAMRYSVFAGGKRLRPVLAIMTHRWAGGKSERIFPVASAIELIHTYSLIHDDLPAMDDDDFRRNKPTCHRVFGEAVAILAGDALSALAFEILAKYGNARVVREVAKAIGTDGLVGGQVLDILGEGKPVSEEDVKNIHIRKTAALFAASARVAAILARSDRKTLDAITRYATNIGLAFQITDDILDIVGNQEELGKDIGSDLQLDKATYPRAVGLERSRQIAQKLCEDAKAALPPDRDNSFFFALADFIVERTY